MVVLRPSDAETGDIPALKRRMIKQVVIVINRHARGVTQKNLERRLTPYLQILPGLDQPINQLPPCRIGHLSPAVCLILQLQV